MATTARRATYDDLLKTPEGGRYRYEIIAGEMIVSPSPVPFHEIVTINLLFTLGPFVRAGRLGRIFGARVDVRLFEHDIVVPDIIFISRDRLYIVGPRAIEGAPDLVVEILSPSTRRRDLTAKRALYERAGVREYWIVDPEARSLTIYVLHGERFEVLPHDGITARSVVLAGLEITVADLFAEDLG